MATSRLYAASAEAMETCCSRDQQDQRGEPRISLPERRIWRFQDRPAQVGVALHQKG